eukprot:scaffold131566_cov28-Tisochrysis_lutea.AAC.1
MQRKRSFMRVKGQAHVQSRRTAETRLCKALNKGGRMGFLPPKQNFWRVPDCQIPLHQPFHRRVLKANVAIL